MKKLKCHCGQFKAEINIVNLDKVLRCNCSICKRKGALMSLVKNDDFIYAKTRYGIEFPSAIKYKGFLGVQFHPEKSLGWGIKVLKNFLES